MKCTRSTPRLGFLLLMIAMVMISSHCVFAQTGGEFSHSSGFGTTREEILANRAKRRDQLVKLLDEAKESLEAHTEGRRLLEEKEFETLSRKIHAYERKLETMQGEMDEREVDRVMQREKLRYERDAARREERRQRAGEL